MPVLPVVTLGFAFVQFIRPNVALAQASPCETPIVLFVERSQYPDLQAWEGFDLKSGQYWPIFAAPSLEWRENNSTSTRTQSQW